MFLLIAGMPTVLCAKNQAGQVQVARQISCLTGAILLYSRKIGDWGPGGQYIAGRRFRTQSSSLCP